MDGANSLVYSPLLLTSSSSGAIQALDQMSGLVLGMLARLTEIESLDRSILAGPVIAELETA